MAIPKHTSPGALTRKQFNYTAPSYEQLIEELEYIAAEFDGKLERFTTNDSTGRQSKKIVIEYDIKNE